MTHNNEKLMPYFILGGYAFFLLGGIFGGGVFEARSLGQMISWQIGNTGAICASIIAAALLSKQDWHLPSAGFIILGIVHGINFSSLLMDTIDERIFATSAIVMVPAILFINFYPVFPFWLRITGWLSATLFLCMYARMLTGAFYYLDWSQQLSYTCEQICMIGWCFYFWKTLIKKKHAPDTTDA